MLFYMFVMLIIINLIYFTAWYLVKAVEPLSFNFLLFIQLPDFVVDQTQAVKFALDIASGMAFLHTLEPMIPRHYLNSKSIMVRNIFLHQKFSFINLHWSISVIVNRRGKKMAAKEHKCLN